MNTNMCSTIRKIICFNIVTVYCFIFIFYFATFELFNFCCCAGGVLTFLTFNFQYKIATFLYLASISCFCWKAVFLSYCLFILFLEQSLTNNLSFSFATFKHSIWRVNTHCWLFAVSFYRCWKHFVFFKLKIMLF